MRERLAVGAVREHRLPGVDDGDDARAQRDLFSAQSIRVARPVETFVVVLDDLLGSRILTVVDAYLTMMTDRPFAPALSQSEAMAELAEAGIFGQDGAQA